MKSYPTQEQLHELLTYNPSTGIFTWNKDVANNVKKGSIAGSYHSEGYRQIRINKQLYFSHRLAWIYVHGTLPDFIDHINQVRNDNRIDNLRSISKQENHMNMKLRTNNSSGTQGVGFVKSRNKWRARITINQKCINLGEFDNIEDAIKVRKEAKVTYSFHKNHS